MKKKYYLFFGFLAIIGIIFVSGRIKQEEQPIIPINMTYQGTKYVNCHINPDYPFKTDEELTTINGILEEKTGSKRFPWRAAVVNGKYLFNPKTDDLVHNFDALKGEFVRIKGYLGKGEITMEIPFKRNETKTITFDNVFYISEINQWENICCDATLEDSGIISTRNVCFWFKK